MSLTTTAKVKRYLPPVLPPEATDEIILDTIAAASADLASRCAEANKEYSADDDRDVLLETVWAAYLVRLQIPGTADEEGSRNDALLKLVTTLCEAKGIPEEPAATQMVTELAPVGPGGRTLEGVAQLPIFKAPKPSTDKYAGADSETVVSPPGTWEH